MPTAFATCDLCDAHKGDTTGGLRVLPPVFKDFGAVKKFAGPVVTVKCFEDNTLVKAAVDSDGRIDTPQGRMGRVLVVDGGGSLRKALVVVHRHHHVKFRIFAQRLSCPHEHGVGCPRPTHITPLSARCGQGRCDDVEFFTTKKPPLPCMGV